MNIIKPIAVCLLICICTLGNVDAQDLTHEQVDVNVHALLVDIDEINSVSESFVANFYIELDWRDSTLAHNNPDSISRSLDEIWHPRLVILNQQRLVQTLPLSVEVKPDGKVVFRQRFWGSFSQQLELKSFPFDSQHLEIILIDTSMGNRLIRLIPSEDSTISERLRIPDWQVMDWGFVTTELPLGRMSAPVPAMVFSLDVKRYTSFFTLKVIFPLLLIVAMSWLVFWIDPSLAATQISVSVTAMLTLIAYRFAIGGMVPRLAFLTSLDYFVLASTILVFLSLVEVIYTYHLTQTNRIESARSLDRKMRWIAPLVYMLLIFESLYLRSWI